MISNCKRRATDYAATLGCVGIIGMVIVFLAVIAFLIGLQGFIIYAAWNWLVVGVLVPTWGLITFWQAVVAGVVLSILGSFFRSSK